jgi:hypothetical protein
MFFMSELVIFNATRMPPPDCRLLARALHFGNELREQAIHVALSRGYSEMETVQGDEGHAQMHPNG